LHVVRPGVVTALHLQLVNWGMSQQDLNQQQQQQQEQERAAMEAIVAQQSC
jgi:hypothetical protein